MAMEGQIWPTDLEFDTYAVRPSQNNSIYDFWSKLRST